MTEAQILNLALTTVPTMTVVLIGILINNARMTDSSARLSDLKDTLRAEIRVVEAQVSGLREAVHAEMEKKPQRDAAPFRRSGFEADSHREQPGHRAQLRLGQ